MPINKSIFIRDIIKELEEENVAVFAGAGLSMPAGYVSWEELLKPIADLENFEFITRNNKRIVKGKQILRIKEVSIETTESGMLNESQLSQEMARFIRELENERQKASN